MTFSKIIVIIAQNFNDMEVVDTVAVFQNLAYPIAVSVVLFMCLAWFGRRMLDEVREEKKRHTDLQQKIFDYLQKANAELSKAIADNADALVRFSKVLEFMEHNKTA